MQHARREASSARRAASTTDQLELERRGERREERRETRGEKRDEQFKGLQDEQSCARACETSHAVADVDALAGVPSAELVIHARDRELGLAVADREPRMLNTRGVSSFLK